MAFHYMFTFVLKSGPAKTYIIKDSDAFDPRQYGSEDFYYFRETVFFRYHIDSNDVAHLEVDVQETEAERDAKVNLLLLRLKSLDKHNGRNFPVAVLPTLPPAPAETHEVN
jgi:hypothetical protein